jgi:hypothetical protein
MKKACSREAEPPMRAEYDFSGGVRGKYVERYRRGSNVILLDPDLVRAFPDSQCVNDTLRAVLGIAARTNPRKAPRARKA